MKSLILAAAIICSLLTSCAQSEDEYPYYTYRAKHILTGAIVPILVLKTLDIYKAGDTVEVNSSWAIRNYMNSSRDTTVHTVVLQAKQNSVQLASH